MSAHALARMLLTLVAGASIWLLGTACSDYAMSDHDAGHDAMPEDLDDGAFFDERQVRLDLIPTQLLDRDGTFRVLPRTTSPHVLDDDVDLGTLLLRPPVWFEGEITAEVLAPYASGGQLPHIIAPLAADVFLRKGASVQRYHTRTDDDGLFVTEVVPHDEYDLVVIPDDPLVPMVIDRIRIGEAPPPQLLELDYGAPLWGRVTGVTGQPLAGVAVHALNAAGRSSETYTDEGGHFELRVPPGHTFQVVSTGRVHGRDPVLTSEPIEVDAEGVRVDLAYADLTPIVRGGTVVDEDGQRVDGVKVRLESQTLEGYAEGTAQHTVEAVTVNGTFDVRLLAGTYRMELLPPAAEHATRNLSPVVLSADSRVDSADFGTITLPPVVPVSGFVLDPMDEPVAEARVLCREPGPDRREWSMYTGADGTYLLRLPQTSLACTLTPPGHRRQELATTHLHVEPTGEQTTDLRFQRGVRMQGRVEHAADGPEAAVVIEVRDSTGHVLGSTLTNEDGTFSLRVAPP